MSDTAPDTDQIEQDLAQTRARLDRRLDELGDRLSPNQLVNDALSHVTGGDGADFTQTLIAKAKANPVPAVLVGVGIAWLMASGRNKHSSQQADLPTRLRSAEAGVVRLNDEHPEVHASRLDDVRGQVLGIARTASDTAASYSQRIKEAVTAASESARQTSRDVRNGASRAVADPRSLASNPLVLGSAAALVGLIAGALIPLRDEERRVLDGVAGPLRSQGRDLAQEVVNRGTQVAANTLEAVKDSAQAHGLTADKPVGELLGDIRSGDLMSQVKQAAGEVLTASKENIQSQLRPDKQD